jgi:hypothetical protein
MAKNPGGRNIVSAVRETLDSVVSPSVRDAILSRALAESQLPELPQEPAELDHFVQGPLQDSLVRSLGPELGMSVASELERIVSIAAKDAAARSKRRPEPVRPVRVSQPLPPTNPNPGKRRATRSTMPSRDAPPADASARTTDELWAEQQRRGMAPTLPAGRVVLPLEVSMPPPGRAGFPSVPASPTSADYPAGTARALGVIGTISIDPRPSALPIVYIATSDGELARTFQAWLDARAVVEPVSAVSTLLRRLAEEKTTRSVVVLDGKNPSIRPLTLAALADELSAQVTVLLWGVPPHVHARMCTVSSAAEKWLVAAGSTSSEEIVARCAKIVR